jgi:hypothetical protein
MNVLMDSVLSEYLNRYKVLVEAEPLSADSLLLSFPFHYSGNHRIELSITRISENAFVISDMAKILEEIRDAGYGIGSETKKRIEKTAANAGLKFRNGYLICESASACLGDDIQKFLEAAKTIADAYLIYRAKPADVERVLHARIKGILDHRNLAYKEKGKISGHIEKHAVDFLIPPNGRPGLALEILAGANSHLLAEAWGFKAEDIKKAMPRLKVGIIYDTDCSKWSEGSKTILENRADIALPGDALGTLDQQLITLGIVAR